MGPLASIAASGLSAASVGMDVSSNNVAHLAASGFQPSAVSYQNAPGGGVAASVENPQTSASVDRTLTALSGTDLVSETVNQIQLLAMFKANVASLRAAEQMDQSLFHIRG